MGPGRRGSIRSCSVRRGGDPVSEESRDIGPYVNKAQVAAQFENWSQGMAGVISSEDAVLWLMVESLYIAGVTPSAEDKQLLRDCDLDPEFAQVLSGMLLRASLDDYTSSAYEKALFASRAMDTSLSQAMLRWMAHSAGPGAASWLAPGR